MEGKNALVAIRDKLGIRLSLAQSNELYFLMSNFLISKDELSFVDLLRKKYALLQDGVSLPVCDYLVMESLLERLESNYAIALAAITYVVRFKS